MKPHRGCEDEHGVKLISYTKRNDMSNNPAVDCFESYRHNRKLHY